LYALAYVLPATFTRHVTGSSGDVRWLITGWGWELALLSVAPLVAVFQSATVELAYALLTITPSNVCFVAAAIALWRQRRGAALVLASIALASMIYGGFVIQRYPGDLIRVPYGHLGPGYYVWVIAGALLLWTAFSSRSAR
jgi:hypothetical protein